MTAVRAIDAERSLRARHHAARSAAGRALLTALGLSLAPLSMYAQGTSVPPCEQGDRHRDFDFWIGEWDVYLPDGTRAGTNSIVAADDGCTLVERWTGARGSTGTSLNFYHPRAELWQQLWVGSDGGVIEISGGLRDGAMVLEGALTGPAGSMQPFRGRWTPNPDGSVRQHFEISSDDGVTWETWFDGRYVRRR